ncbi:hypothetical protein [Paenibacillus sediminis]|uniref:Uncharacterized protein n=1 Tax=Paenibacillus sediminis TaxID=664909 RepID=A0ABS4H6R6_9BACL|nr:hypothetical protein [Paenibacillus sediminis]MBP1938238.1 hypothetical protein [Paenibacillus sediminis]
MRFMKWLSKTVFIVILVSSLTILTTAFVVNTYVKSILSSFHITLEGNSFTFGSMLNQMFTGKSNNSSIAPMNTEADRPASTGEENSASTADDTHSEAGTQNRSNDNGATNGGNKPEDSLEVMGRASSTAEQSASTDQVVVSPDEMTQKKEQLSTEDKDQIFNILMKKVPQEEIQNISAEMESGLTEEELHQMEQVLSKYLTKEEYNKLMDIIQK